MNVKFLFKLKKVYIFLVYFECGIIKNMNVSKDKMRILIF